MELSWYMDSTAQWTDVNATDIKVCTQLYSRVALEQSFMCHLRAYQLSNKAIIVLGIDEYFVGFIIIIRYVRT